MVEVPVCVGNISPQVVDPVDAVIGGLEKDWGDGIGEMDKFVIKGLSIDEEEERLGCCGAEVIASGVMVAGWGNVWGGLPVLKTRNIY